MITYLLVKLVDVYTFLILVYILMSWIPQKSGWIYEINRALRMICEPYLGLFRRIIPPLGGIDFSPILAIFGLQVIVRLIYIIL